MKNWKQILFFCQTFFQGLILTLFFCQHLASQSSVSSISIFEENGVKGILDSNGKEVIPAKYYDLGWTKGLPEFHQSIIGYRESEKWGLIKANNKIITPPKYSHLFPSDNPSLFIAALPGRFSGEHFFGLINSNGKVVIPFMYAGLEVFGEVAIIRTLAGNRTKYGIINMNNEPIIPFQYDLISTIDKNLLAVTKADHKIVLINSRGKEIIRYNLDSLGNIENQYYRIYSEGKVGLMGMEGNLIANPEFKRIEIDAKYNKLSFLRFNEWTFLDSHGNTGSTILADEIIEVVPGVYRISLNKQSWLTDDSLNILSKPFDKIFPVSDHHFKTYQKKRYGLINLNGQEILPPFFDSLHIKGSFVYASRIIGNRTEWDLYDTLGVKKSYFEYQAMRPASEGLIAVMRNGKWGFITREGMELIHCVYDYVSPFHNNRSIVSLHGEEGIIDSEGNWIIFPRESKIQVINDSLLLEKSGSNNRLVTFKNELIYFTENELSYEGSYLEELVDSATIWHISLSGTIINEDARPNLGPITVFDSLFIVYQKAKAGIVSESGRMVVPFGEWEEIYPPSEDFFGIKSDGFYGFIDIDNKLRIANRYEGIGPFKEGLAAIKVRGKWGFIDQRESLICQPLYDEVGEFSNNTCVVRSGNLWGLIGNDGKLIQETEYTSIETVDSGFMVTIKDGDYGLLNKVGKTILFPKYEWLDLLSNGTIMIKRKDLFGVLNSNGVNILPAIHHKLRYIPDADSFLSMIPGQWETKKVESN